MLVNTTHKAEYVVFKLILSYLGSLASVQTKDWGSAGGSTLTSEVKIEGKCTF